MTNSTSDSGSWPERGMSHSPTVQRSLPDPSRSLNSSPPGQASVPITPMFVLRAIRRWWKIATPIALVFAAIGVGIIWFTFKPVYIATAWLRIEEQSPYIVYQMPTNTRTFRKTQAELIRSTIVLEKVLAHPEIAEIEELQEAPSADKWLAERVRVSAPHNSQLFRVGFRAEQPGVAAVVCNTIVNEYLKMQDEDENIRMQMVIELLEKEKARRGATVDRLRQNIRELRRRATEQNPFDNSALLSDGQTFRHPLEQLQSQITKIEVDLEIREAKLKAYETFHHLHDRNVSDEELTEALERHPKIQNIRKALSSQQLLLNRIADASSRGTKDPYYLARLEELKAKENNYQELMTTLRVQLADEIRESRLAKSAKTIHSMKQQIANDKLTAKILRDRYFRQLKDVKGAGDTKLNLQFERAELSREEQVFQLIAARTMKLRTEMRAPAKVSSLKKADPPTFSSAKLSYKRMAVFGMAGFLLPFGLVVVWERIVRRIGDTQQLWQANLNVVGEIARLPVNSSDITSTSVGRDVSLFEESIDSLRTCLALSDYTTESRVLVVSSAVSGEGKTSVASQLAVSIARSTGQPTLLIDADMRSPDIHNVFDIPNRPGLAQVLGREAKLDDAIVTTWSNYVHLMPAGELEASPHKLLGDGALKDVMEQVRAKYKNIIIDTSPILSASESLVLAKAADGTLLCAMRDVSRLDQVQRAYERLINTGAKPIGTVLNGVPTGRYAYMYGIYSYPRD